MPYGGKARWKPGHSGNPRGRPKVDFLARDEARKYGQEAIEKLVQHMRGDDARVSVVASTAILDRGYGKPTQVLAADPEMPPITIDLSGLSDAEIQRVETALGRAVLLLSGDNSEPQA